MPNGPLGTAVYETFDRLLPGARQLSFGLRSTVVDGQPVAVEDEAVLCRPFCTLRHFRRDVRRVDPRLLVVAPLSGHCAVLLEDMVAALLPEHDVYVTDWTDARQVPVEVGEFGLADNIGYVIDFIRRLGPDVHVVGLCQSAVPVLAATALSAAAGGADQPRSLVLLGGPVDPRIAPTRVERLLAERPLAWFAQNVIASVPAAYPAAGRRVYPGALQLMALTAYLMRHVRDRGELFYKLGEDEGRPAQAHGFFQLYSAVMDLTAEFFLENVQALFQDCLLPRGQMRWQGQAVDLAAIARTALLTVEGQFDDIAAPGQTRVAHDHCVNLPAQRHAHHLEPGIGHFGLFHGGPWRAHILPRLRDFVRTVGQAPAHGR